MIQLKNRKIMVVVAHPDDELLGCGATMHKLIYENNCTIKTIILGKGITSRYNERNTGKQENELIKHQQNIEIARKYIGYESVKSFDFPDNRFDTVPLLDIIKTI
jgi:LmbE family N-acetylglucosaminyl deacetylase